MRVRSRASGLQGVYRTKHGWKSRMELRGFVHFTAQVTPHLGPFGALTGTKGSGTRFLTGFHAKLLPRHLVQVIPGQHRDLAKGSSRNSLTGSHVGLHGHLVQVLSQFLQRSAQVLPQDLIQSSCQSCTTSQTLDMSVPATSLFPFARLFAKFVYNKKLRYLGKHISKALLTRTHASLPSRRRWH